MNPHSKLLFLCLFLPGFSFLQAQTDSIENAFDCTERFFQRGEKATNPNKAILITKAGKTQTLPNFLKAISMGGSSSFIDYTVIDLDKDGKQELVITNNTGGAHCCDELYFFKNTGPGKYQFAAKTFAGDVCVSDSNEFTYSFYQQLGYFFTCFACAYLDTSDAAPVEIRGIILKYNKGKLMVVPGDQELRSIINDNLGKLGEQPYEKLESAIAQDNGLRKEFAMNLAVFYYSFGRNLPETQKLFAKYYKFPDAQKVWAEFVKQLQLIRKGSDF